MATTNHGDLPSAQPPVKINGNRLHIVPDSRPEDEGIPILANIDSQQCQNQPLADSKASIAEKLTHQCSTSSGNSDLDQTGEFVEALRAQYFYRKKEGRQAQSYYVGQEFNPQKTPPEEWAIALVQGQKGFKLEASFDHVPTGYYNIVWSIQRQELFKVHGAFHVRVIVEYEKEPWHKARYEFKHRKRSIKKALKQTGWRTLESAERIQVHPHIGGANITVVLSRASKIEGFGVQFQKVELKPAVLTTPGRFNKENVEPPHFRVHASNDAAFQAITRLEYSRQAHYLAALSILKTAVRVQVWDIRDIQNSQKENIADRGAAFDIELKHAQHLAIGMAISPSGDQIAVFQEPRIGRWGADSAITDAEFPFRLFRNPLVRKTNSTLNNQKEAIININVTGMPLQLEEITIEHSFLNKMIGYGQFVSITEQEEDEEEGPHPTRRRRKPTQNHVQVVSFFRRHKGECDLKPSIFVSCNGYYLDVFDASNPKWEHLQTIELNNLSPLYSRRFTCESMMELLAGDRFLWFENGNRCCSVWDIMTGTNVSYIETTPVKLNDVRGNNTLTVSPNYEYLAIAGADGSISTYMIDSGVRMDKRKFPGSTIEYIGFHGNQSNELFVYVRDTLTRDLNWYVLDPFQLRSERKTRPIPVPTKDGAIMASFKEEGFEDRNLVCVPNGPDIEFYWTSEPKPPASLQEREQLSDTQIMEDLVKVPVHADKDVVAWYEIKVVVFMIKNVTGSSEPRPAQGVEIYASMEGEDAEQSKEIFAMVPEPWVWLDLEEDAVKQPKPLSAFFLPCMKRFVILGSFSVQVWYLPTKTEPKCRLHFYWSQPLDKPFDEAKKVQSFYRPIRSGQVHGNHDGSQWIRVNLGSKRNPQYEEFDLPAPGAVDRTLQLQYCIQSIYLLAATHLFASTGSEPDALKSFSKVDVIDFNDQAKSIRRFVQDHINRTIHVKGLDVYEFDRHSNPPATDVDSHFESNVKRASKDTSRNPEKTSILLRLVDPERFLVSNAGFVIALLGSGECNWIPPQDIKLNPVLKAAQSGNTNITQSLIDYCILMTRKRHPYYMLPVIQSVEVLAEHFPDMLKDTFVKVSFVPALPYALSTTRIYMFRRRWNVHLGPVEKALEWLGIFHSRNDSDQVSRPVYQMQPYLDAKRIQDGALRIKNFPKDSIGNSLNEKNNNGDNGDISKGQRNGNGNVSSIHFHGYEQNSSRRPASDESSRSKRAMIQTMYDRQVFVAPFPCFSTYADPNSTDKRATYFSRLAGRNFFDSPAMKATLVFKWYRYGFLFWLMRFLYLFAFYSIFTVITAHLISVSAVDPNEPDSIDVVNRRYLSRPWMTLILANAIMGAPLLLLELWQLVKEGWFSYLSSIFNLLDVLSVSLVIVSNSLILVNSNTPEDDEGKGPHQVWVVGFSILIMYLHLMFELRVIRSLGIFVNIIISITKKIVIFFILLTVMMVGFTHALMYSTHTHQFECQPGSEGCDLKAGATQYPRWFFAALAATYYFLGGRWDPLNDEMDSPSGVAFHIIMIVFLFFSVILLMNVLIAIMNIAYEDCREEGELAWLKQWSQVLDEFAHIFLSPWQKQTYLPDYIYYEATVKEVMSYSEENGLTNLENAGIGSAAAAKMEGGKYTFVALSREEVSSIMPGSVSLPGTLKKSTTPPTSRKQLPDSVSTVTPPVSFSPLTTDTQASTVKTAADTVIESSATETAVAALAASASAAAPVSTTGLSESFSVKYEEYSDKLEMLQTRFDQIMEEELEALEATEDCTSTVHDHQQHQEARDKLQGELQTMQVSVQSLSENMKHTLMEYQVPLEREAREPMALTHSTEPGLATIEIDPSSPSPVSPLSGTTTLLPRRITSIGDDSHDYFESPTTPPSTAELTLDMVRLRDLYYTTLELEKSIQQEISPDDIS